MKCQHCDKAFSQNRALVTHMEAVHDKIKFYQCSRCEYRTGHSSALKRHERNVHEKSSQIAYVCDICDYQTVHKSALKRHVANRHEKETQITHACSICDYKTTYEFALQRHYTTVHLKEGVYECGQCEYNTVHKHALDRHVKMVHEKPANLSCVHCDYKSAHKSSLRLHYATVHESKDTYKCDKCGVAKLDSFMLRSHFSDEHDLARTIKSIEEELCISNEKELAKLKSDKIKSRIDKFIKISKEKEQKRFKPAGEQRVESVGGRSSYKCSFCDTIIKDKYNLNRHINALHTMNKWYKCNKCGETTLYRNNHIHHMRRVHDIDASTAQVDKTMIVTDEEEIMQLREEKIKRGNRVLLVGTLSG